MGKLVFSPLICSHSSLSKSTHSNIFKRGLAMACLNINSLISHMDDLKILMYDTNIDILAINETKLDNSVLNNEVHLDGYEIIGKDRYTNGGNGGGVCIYVRNNLNYRIRNDLINENLEFLMTEISKPRSKPFLVVLGIDHLTHRGSS